MPNHFVIEKIKRDPEPSVVVPQTGGICSTCRNESNCIYYQSRGEVIHFCEEYDGDEARLVISPKNNAGAAAAPVKIEKLPAYKGLCINCEKRESCRFEKPEEGVWHCEEYE